jgi:hypothetical protein
MTSNKIVSLTASVVALAFLLAVIIPAFRVDALTSSSLTLSDSRPSATGVNYSFASSGFDTGTTVRCIQLDIGTAVDGSGDAGLTVGSATLASNTITGSGWTVGNVEGTDQLRATDSTGATPSASGSIAWGGIINGSTADTTYFGLFQTFTDTDCSTGGPVDSVVVTLIFKAGALVSLTIDPTLTFSILAVGSGQAVNGATTTVTSTASSINFLNSVTPLAKGVSAHNLEVGTNAPGGYTVYIRHSSPLQSGANTIDNHAGTNAAPSLFPAAGTEAWGYTSADSTLTGGTADRFTNPGNFWAGFTTTNQPVMHNPSAPSGTETSLVGHQVGVSSATEAGTYQTTIIYTAASVY